MRKIFKSVLQIAFYCLSWFTLSEGFLTKDACSSCFSIRCSGLFLQTPSHWTNTRTITTTARFLLDEDNDLQQVYSFNTENDSSLFEALEARQKELEFGIGKRYVTRTQKGFLNVHYEPTDPFDQENIVSQLQEGQIVTSTGPTRGFWIPHDAGGWSISKHAGFTFLEPIDE